MHIAHTALFRKNETESVQFLQAEEIAISKMRKRLHASIPSEGGKPLRNIPMCRAHLMSDIIYWVYSWVVVNRVCDLRPINRRSIARYRRRTSVIH